MKAFFLIGVVAKRPRPVRERPIRKALLLAILADRMPVILAPGDCAHWLSEEPDPRAVMLSSPAGWWRMWPFSTGGNNPKNDPPSFLKSVGLADSGRPLGGTDPTVNRSFAWGGGHLRRTPAMKLV